MSDDDPLSKASAIPELYYDLISRVTPGGLFLLAVALSAGGESGVAWFGRMGKELEGVGFATVFLVAFATGGYFVGMLLTPLGWAIAIPVRAAVWYQLRERYGALVVYLQDLLTPQKQAAAPETITPLGYWDYDRLDRLMHDILKDRNAQARVILPKMRAEAGLCHNAAAAVVLWGMLRGSHAGFGSVLSAMGPLLLTFSLSLVAALFREYRLMRRQFAFLELLKANLVKSEGDA